MHPTDFATGFRGIRPYEPFLPIQRIAQKKYLTPPLVSPNTESPEKTVASNHCMGSALSFRPLSPARGWLTSGIIQIYKAFQSMTFTEALALNFML